MAQQAYNKESNVMIVKEDFKEKSLGAMKENFLYSMLAFLWSNALSDAPSESHREEIRKRFSSLWRNNMFELTQKQLGEINKSLCENNIDMLNIIAGDPDFADVEDYQEVITENVKEVDDLFWRLCGEGRGDGDEKQRT